MPKIKWRDLPPDLLGHLFDRAKEREIPLEDLFALEEWRKHSPVNWRSAASAASGKPSDLSKPTD